MSSPMLRDNGLAEGCKQQTPSPFRNLPLNDPLSKTDPFLDNWRGLPGKSIKYRLHRKVTSIDKRIVYILGNCMLLAVL